MSFSSGTQYIDPPGNKRSRPQSKTQRLPELPPPPRQQSSKWARRGRRAFYLLLFLALLATVIWASQVNDHAENEQAQKERTSVTD